MELLWCNGHVVMQSQGHRKLPPRPEKAAPAVQAEDEAGLWFPFAVADSLDKDIFSDLFCDTPPPGAADKPSREGDVKPSELMPPPKSTHVSSSMSMSLADNVGELSDLVQARAGKAAVEEGASSTLSAIGASFCGSNQVQVQRAASEHGRAGTTAYGGSGAGSALPSAVGSGNANAIGRGREATMASSSGRSDYCFGATTTTTTYTTGTEPTSTSNRSTKRKRGLDTDDSTDSPSEVRFSFAPSTTCFVHCSDADAMKQDAESESAVLERKPPQKLSTVRRSRAAEVHNLSERVRRVILVVSSKSAWSTSDLT
jgi:phytochrome-interacting factor 4